VMTPATSLRLANHLSIQYRGANSRCITALLGTHPHFTLSQHATAQHSIQPQHNTAHQMQ
jgi:galactose mutarotase-like enzyme